MPKRGSSKGISTSKKIIIFGVIAALVASTFAIVYSSRLAEEQQAKQLEEARKKQEEIFKMSRCGDGIVRSNSFIKEYMIPQECVMPVGIAVDKDGTVWTASSVTNSVIRFDPSTEEFEEFKIPSQVGNVTSGIPLPMWALAFDGNGRLWITDSENNSIWMFNPSISTSEMFKEFKLQKAEPFGTSMPVDIKVSKDRLWFVGVYSKHIGMIDLNTLELVEIPIDVDLNALGTIDVDSKGNVWFTALTLGTKGMLYMLDPTSKEMKAYDLPIGSPVGISIDEARGKIWINDHGSNLFISFNPSTNEVIRYSTSLPARYTNIGLYEDCIKSNPRLECSGYPVSLPYWNAIDSKGRVWFNEHQGNAIAVFNPDDSTLIEYNIPSYNKAWGKCEGSDEQCGIANALRFALQDDGSRVKVWFTEFTENKLGMLDPDAKELPFTVSVNTDTIKVKKGDTARVEVNVEAREPVVVDMLASGSIDANGRLSKSKISAEYSEYSLRLDGRSSKTVILTLKPNELESGEYTLTIGARSNEVAYSKIVRLIVE
ncbi:MAG: SMP-30/gluconolactonase/LRE family protein [Candidatus Nitrosocaldus sp.]